MLSVRGGSKCQTKADNVRQQERELKEAAEAVASPPSSVPLVASVVSVPPVASVASAALPVNSVVSLLVTEPHDHAGATAAANNNNDVGGIRGVAHRTTAIIGTPPNVTNNKRKAPAQVTASVVGKKKKRDTEFYMKVKCSITEQGIAYIPTTNDDGMNYATVNIYDVDKGTEEEQPMPVCAFASNTSNVAADSILQHLRDQF